MEAKGEIRTNRDDIIRSDAYASYFPVNIDAHNYQLTNKDKNNKII